MLFRSQDQGQSDRRGSRLVLRYFRPKMQWQATKGSAIRHEVRRITSQHRRPGSTITALTHRANREAFIDLARPCLRIGERREPHHQYYGRRCSAKHDTKRASCTLSPRAGRIGCNTQVYRFARICAASLVSDFQIVVTTVLISSLFSCSWNEKGRER